MKAAIKTSEGTFSVTQTDMPQLPGEDWVIAEVRVAGICGTDLRHWKKHEPSLEGKIMGHEVAGVVMKTGSKVNNVREGDRVVIETVLGDGTCEWCAAGQYNRCPNLYAVRNETVSRDFADYIVAPARKLYKLPDHVSFEEAALLDTFSVSLHGIQLSGLKVNDKVVVMGAGCIGLAELQLAKVCGADVIICDVVESALELARELGADEVVNPEKEDLYARIMEFTGNRGADIAFECAGGSSMGETLRQVCNSVRIGGKVVIVGGFDAGMTEMPLPWQHLQMSEIKLIPSASYAFWDIYPEMGICLDLLSKGKINAKKMITHHFDLDHINEGFGTAQDKQNTGAVFVALQMNREAAEA